MKLLLILAAAALWLVFYSKLPAELPIHWNMKGEIDGYSTKLGAMLTNLGIMILLYLLFRFLPKIDPKKENYKSFSRSYSIINSSLFVFFFLINLMVILTGLGYDLSMNSLMPVILGGLFIVLGNYMQQVKPNYFVGIKTPWTLADENVWRQTHRFSSKVFVAAGIIVLLALLAPSEWRDFIILPSILGAALVSVGSSYYFFKKKKDFTSKM
ncbi:SdpI family protein [Fictibacillus terranigra]|uniref:SdpI family protein n=1 Tax=Fictibacillus terranigra TaxID=3058424 RepID=A0ABT8EB74_9BACL|nr:SdpI family protein [Fictibacillus sp. CENA-BCM004]MDN4075159.1 SdpI family protein [Fictibacillus sp. CENA-BCM004]